MKAIKTVKSEFTNEGMLFKTLGDNGSGRLLEWYSLLAKTIQAYTKGESSSLPIETAGRLLSSLVYTVHLTGVELMTPEKTPLQSLYDQGRALLDGYMVKARRVFAMAQAAMLPIDAPCYQEAIQKGGPSFFKAYNPSFFAHETPGDIDYFTSITICGSGVTWMLGFYEAMYWESVFCRRFPFRDIEEALNACGIWGQAVPLNVFEPVFAAAMLGSLMKKEKPSLCVTREDHQRLQTMLEEKTQEEIRLLTSGALKRLVKAMEVRSPAYLHLMTENADSLAPRLYTALKNESLAGLFPAW